jgi:hypothetical protein
MNHAENFSLGSVQCAGRTSDKTAHGMGDDDDFVACALSPVGTIGAALVVAGYLVDMFLESQARIVVGSAPIVGKGMDGKFETGI